MHKKVSDYKKYNGSLDDGEYPKTVYKYRTWTKELHKTILKERQVYMSSPADFEDDLDCKNPIRYDLLKPKQLVEFYIRLLRKENPQEKYLKLKQLAYKQVRNSKLKDDSFIEKFTSDYFEDYFSRKGVLSLTANPRIDKMWTDYGDGHHGICVGFNSRTLFEFLGGGGPVNYDDVLPIILPSPFMDLAEQHLLNIFHKLKKWEYEEEYRTHMMWDHPVSREERIMQLPPEAYSEVILGNNLSVKGVEEITEIVRTNIGDIPVKTENE